MESTNLAEFPEEVNRLLAERATLRENEHRTLQVVQQFAAFAAALKPHAGTGVPTPTAIAIDDLPAEVLQHTAAIQREADAIDKLSRGLGTRSPA